MVEDPAALDEPEAPARRQLSPGLTLGLVAAALVVTGRLSVPPAVAAYDDCDALRADFPSGVGTHVRPDVYRANRSLDADRDGVACGSSRR